MRRAASIAPAGNRIGQRSPLDLVQIDDDARLERRRDALVRKGDADAGGVLSGHGEVIEAHRRVDLERPQAVRSGFHRADSAGLQVHGMVLRQRPPSSRRCRWWRTRPAR